MHRNRRSCLLFRLTVLLLCLLLCAVAGPVQCADTDDAVLRTFRQRIAEIKNRQGRITPPGLPAEPAASPIQPTEFPGPDNAEQRYLPAPDLAIYLGGMQEQLQAMQRSAREADVQAAAASRQAKVAAALAVAALSLALLALLFAGRAIRRAG